MPDGHVPVVLIARLRMRRGSDPRTSDDRDPGDRTGNSRVGQHASGNSGGKAAPETSGLESDGATSVQKLTRSAGPILGARMVGQGYITGPCARMLKVGTFAPAVRAPR